MSTTPSPHPLLAILLLSLLACAAPAQAQPQPAPIAPYDQFTTEWRNDATWHDGQAEWAEYDATRVIYGKPRQYTARIITNTEHASAETFTKSDTGRGRAVFKQHTREDVPTTAYTYHFSTMCYVGQSDLKSLKIDMGSQEDCGSSFKQITNHAGKAWWHQFSYFPNQGHRAGDFAPPANLVYHDALPIVLRGYPFDKKPTLELALLPDFTTTKWSPTDLVPVTVTYVGRETLDLPIGQTEAHHLRVRAAPGSKTEDAAAADKPGIAADLWFHADGSAPLLHVLVQYKDPAGTQFKLASHKRWAYWAAE